jgi:hypothetical protein
MKNRIFSYDSAKAIKANDYGWLNAIMYMSPHTASGVANLCGNASPGCIALCLGLHSGQASMVLDSDNVDSMNSVRQSRKDKAIRFMRDRAGFMRDVVRSIGLMINRADRLELKLCVRLNGSQDIAWHKIKIRGVWAIEYPELLPHVGKSIVDAFPQLQFVDYTKDPKRFDGTLPRNYHLTFSRSEDNEAQCLELLARGVNVAIVFANGLPATWNGFQVIDGDRHDLRHLDPTGPRGFVVGLSPKGRAAKRDRSGFVVRSAA